MRENAQKILNIYRFYNLDGRLYLCEDRETIDSVFDAVVDAIEASGPLKPLLPHREFVLPSYKVIQGDPGWVGHFEDRDNRRFFLSDIYDYMTLFSRGKVG